MIIDKGNKTLYNIFNIVHKIIRKINKKGVIFIKQTTNE